VWFFFLDMYYSFRNQILWYYLNFLIINSKCYHLKPVLGTTTKPLNWCKCCSRKTGIKWDICNFRYMYKVLFRIWCNVILGFASHLYHISGYYCYYRPRQIDGFILNCTLVQILKYTSLRKIMKKSSKLLFNKYPDKTRILRYVWLIWGNFKWVKLTNIFVPIKKHTV
jgi:hypothetical protein